MEEKKINNRILLHSCCGPCSTAVVERLLEDWDITVFYYNPNITDPEEYRHRLAEQKRFLKEFSDKTGHSVDFIEGKYDPDYYFSAVSGLEEEPEGGARCSVCFRIRLEETAKIAKELGIETFDSTLSVSPHKNYQVISEIGKEIAEKERLTFAAGNYKKKDGYKRSTELSREYDLYRQNFCGCVFSNWTLKKDESSE